MKYKFFIFLLLCQTVNLFAQPAAKPIWEFGVNKLPATDITGDLSAKGKSFFLDGTNSFRLPPGILGDGKEYTIEFDLKTESRRDTNLIIFSMQDCDYEKGPFRMKVEKGFAFAFYGFGSGMLYMNGSQTAMGVNEGTVPIPYKGEGKFYKLTFVVKDGRIQYFRNGLILLQTEAHHPIDKNTVLRFGQLRKKDKRPAMKTKLELRNLKIYDKIVYPTGYDDSISKRLNYSGPEYSLMREPIKDPKLKRVLVVGDSISMSYRSQISKHLEGKAYVDYWMGGTWFGPGVCKDGKKSKPYIAWQGVASQGPYDVITFNPMTLHWWNLKQNFRCNESFLADTLQKYFDYIKASMPNAKIIYLNCTPWRSLLPDGSSSVDNDSNRRIIKFNKICEPVVAKNNITSVNLYSIALKHLPNVRKNNKDSVHWNKACSEDFAKAINKEIDKILK